MIPSSSPFQTSSRALIMSPFSPISIGLSTGVFPRLIKINLGKMYAKFSSFSVQWRLNQTRRNEYWYPPVSEDIFSFHAKPSPIHWILVLNLRSEDLQFRHVASRGCPLFRM